MAIISVVVGTLASPALVTAQNVMRVEDVVHAALDRPELDERLDAQLVGARAELDEATVIPVPRLGLTHEQVFGDPTVGYREFSATVEQSFDLSRWRRTLRESLTHRESALRAETQGWQLEAATSVREAFYRVRYHDERIATLDVWITQLVDNLEGIEARAERGDASVYHVRRIQREIALAHAMRAEEGSALSEAWAELERWTSWPERPQLEGALQPAMPTDSSEGASYGRPELARLEHMRLALEAEAQALGSSFWRDWSVGAGYRHAKVGENTGHGILATLSIPLAFWNTAAPRRQLLQARQLEVSSSLALRTDLATREVETSRERLAAALRSIQAMAGPEHDVDLTRLAQLAFSAGEASLIELLDAFESDTDLQLTRIDLQWAARRAAIALDHNLGIGVPQ